MKRDQILSAIRTLSMSQGFYGRLYNELMEIKSANPENYEAYMTELEGRNFSDIVDMIMFFEC